MLLLVAAALVRSSGQARTVELDATPWEFQADPLDVGVGERWYSPAATPKLARTITTPGETECGRSRIRWT